MGTSNGSNIIKVLSHNGVDAGLQLGSTLVEATATDLNKLSGITDGQVTAEKAIVVDSSSDIVGINNITSTGKITSQEQETIKSTITNGLKLDVATKSFSDATKAIILDSGIDGDQIYTNTSAGAGSVVDATDIYSLRGATLASTLTNVTTTNASTLHVKGAPSAGNNMTLTNANALRVSGGNTLLEGDINVSGSSVFGGDVTFNGQMTTNSGMTINGSITGGSDSTLADIKFTSGKIETTNVAGLTIMNPINVAGNIFVESDNPELLMKASSASDGTPRIKLVSDNSGEKGDSLEIKTLNGVTTISSDHNSIGVFDAEILKLTGNATSSDVAVETVGQLRADSIKLADGKNMIL